MNLPVRNAIYCALDDVPFSFTFEQRRALIEAVTARLEEIPVSGEMSA